MDRKQTTRSLRRGETGQALVEAALVLPVLLIVLFGVVMAGRVVHAKIAVQAAAREGTRALATAASENQGLAESEARARSVAQGYGLSGGRLAVETSSNGFVRGGTVVTEVTYRVPLAGLPLLNLGDVVVSSTHSERIDLYRSREVTSP